MGLHKERSSEPHQVLADRLGGAKENLTKTTTQPNSKSEKQLILIAQ
jgi:hypothetical protein